MIRDQYTCDCEVIHEEVVARVREKMPGSDDFLVLADFYKLLADKTRVRILWALSYETMCVCDLAVLLNMTKSAISHQLKSLRLSKLVKSDKRGREVYYSLSDEHVREILLNAFVHTHEAEELPCHTHMTDTTTTNAAVDAPDTTTTDTTNTTEQQDSMQSAADAQTTTKLKIKINSFG